MKLRTVKLYAQSELPLLLSFSRPGIYAEGLPSQGRGDGKIMRVAYCLEKCIGTGGWQCRYIRGKCSYICRSKRGRKTRALWREIVATTECVTL